MSTLEQKQTKKMLPRMIAAAAIVALVLAGLLLVLHFWEDRQDDYPSQGGGTGNIADGTDSYDDRYKVRFDGKWYYLKNNIRTLLVMGIDTTSDNDGPAEGSFNNYARADFLALLVIDDKNETIRAIHVDRDSMSSVDILGFNGEIVGSTVAQLAVAYAYGSGKTDSCENTVRAVSTYLYGTEIDHYVSLTMDAVQKINDKVGGVTVTVLDDFSGIDDTLVLGEEVTLYGQHALTYVRARKGLDNSTNSHRMERQRQYLNGFYTQAKSAIASDPMFGLDLITSLSDQMLSDCTATQLSDLLNAIDEYEFIGIDTIKGESMVGDSEHMEFYADEDALQRQIIDIFYDPKEGGDASQTAE